MDFDQLFILIFCIAAYVLIATLLYYFVWRLTGRLLAWLRLLIRTFVLAMMITPSLLYAVGEGGAAFFPGPVIFTFILGIQGHNWNYLLFYGVIPVVCGWFLAIIVSIIYYRFFKKKDGPVA